MARSRASHFGADSVTPKSGVTKSVAQLAVRAPDLVETVTNKSMPRCDDHHTKLLGRTGRLPRSLSARRAAFRD